MHDISVSMPLWCWSVSSVYSFIAYGSSKNWIKHYKSRPIHWQSHHINRIINRIKKHKEQKCVKGIPESKGVLNASKWPEHLLVHHPSGDNAWLGGVRHFSRDFLHTAMAGWINPWLVRRTGTGWRPGLTWRSHDAVVRRFPFAELRVVVVATTEERLRLVHRRVGRKHEIVQQSGQQTAKQRTQPVHLVLLHTDTHKAVSVKCHLTGKMIYERADSPR